MRVVRRLSRSEGPVEADDMLEYIERDRALNCYDYPAERKSRMRLLQRDIEDIEEMFGIRIERAGKSAYRLAERSLGAAIDYDRLFADFDILTSLNPDGDVSKYILPERSRYAGSEHLSPLLTAIKESVRVQFDYTNVRKGGTVKRHEASPLFLKEDQRRWYLIGQTEKGVRLFALDRMSGLRLTGEGFSRDEGFDPEAMFRDSFGIWSDPDIPVEDVELRYDALDGSFLKTVPLHHSQQVIADTPDEFRIRVRLRITNDFVMELLSRSRSLEVISPEHLRRRVHDVMEAGAERNMAGRPSSGQLAGQGQEKPQNFNKQNNP